MFGLGRLRDDLNRVIERVAGLEQRMATLVPEVVAATDRLRKTTESYRKQADRAAQHGDGGDDAELDDLLDDVRRQR